MDRDRIGSAVAKWSWKISKSVIRISIAVIIASFLLSMFEVFPAWETLNALAVRVSSVRRVYDEAGILPSHDKEKFEQYLSAIFMESDVDMRFIFVKDTGKKTIEELAAEKVQKLGIGGKSREERGVLFLYDLGGKKLRVEVGYGLESYFPDALVSYLMNEHANAYFSSGDVSLGLRLTLRMLHHRIREEILGNTFDPRTIEAIRDRRHLSGGAGASSAMAIGGDEVEFLKDTLSEEERRQYYSPQPTPDAVYDKYQQWLSEGKFDPKIDIFTQPSQEYLSSLPISKGYFDFFRIYGRGAQYKFEERGNVALHYSTDNPLASPHFFVKDEKGWRVDIVAEVNHVISRMGGVYTWDYRMSDDIYTRTFKDMFVTIRGYVRIKDGDNRQLPVREDGQKKAMSKMANLPKRTRAELASLHTSLGSLISKVTDKGQGELSQTAGWTELHFAAANGDLGEVRKLLEKHPVDEKNARGRTPLYEAAKRGRLEVVGFLADKGSDINSRDTDVGFTALHVAAEQKHIDIILFLLSRGAEVDIRNDWGQTPLWQASWQPWHGDDEVARVLHEHSAELNPRDNKGITPLDMAAASGHIPLIRFLIEKGADVNVRANNGETPLMSAAKYGQAASVSLLLEYGADKDIMAGQKSAQTIAEQKGYEEISQLLRRRR